LCSTKRPPTCRSNPNLTFTVRLPFPPSTRSPTDPIYIQLPPRLSPRKPPGTSSSSPTSTSPFRRSSPSPPHCPPLNSPILTLPFFPRCQRRPLLRHRRILRSRCQDAHRDEQYFPNERLRPLRPTSLPSARWIQFPPRTPSSSVPSSSVLIALYSQEHYVSISDVARTHVDAALNPTISNGHRYLLIADRASWQQVGRAAVTAQPELKSHLPPLPESPSEEEKTFSRFSYEADRVEKDFGWKCTLASPPSLRSASSTDSFSLRTDQPLEEYVGEFARDLVKFAKAGGQL
jgi:hypothetical protein